MRLILALAVLVLALLPAGCGSKKPSAEQTVPFATAIEQYLRASSMEMKIDAFETLSITGDAAAARVSVELADETYKGLAQRWTFHFERSGAGWKVSRVDR